MRIGIVTEYYRPWPGGISEHVHHEAAELRRRGHEVVILTGPASRINGDERTPPPGSDEGVHHLGFDLQFTSNGARSRMVLGRYLVTLRAIFRRLELDLVHIHAPMDPFLGWTALAASEVATVGTFHASFTPSLLWNTLYRALRPVSKPLFDRMHGRIAVSPEARRVIAHYFPAHYEIIPNGVDTSRFHPDCASSALRQAGPTILFVGRSDPRKGLALLVSGFAQVRRRVEGARLVIVGDLAQRESNRILAGVDAETASSILLAGYVPPEDLPGYFAACDVFCSPATGQESQGIVLLEAMATGRPCVVFDIPGYRDVVVSGRDGLLVEEVSADALALGLSELLSNAEQRGRMGERARVTALDYAWPAVVERLEKQFFDACEVARSRD